MKPIHKLISSAVTAFIIAGGGAVLTAMSDGGMLSANMMVGSLVTGLIAAAKDWRTYNARSPKEK